MVARRYVIGAGSQQECVWLALEAQQKNCNWCTANKLGCLIESICVVKQKRTEASGVKVSKEPKRAWVDGSDGEVDSRSDDTKFVGFDMGVQVTQDLLVALLRIHQEMSVQSEIMQQMLQSPWCNWTSFGSAAMIWSHKPRHCIRSEVGCWQCGLKRPGRGRRGCGSWS